MTDRITITLLVHMNGAVLTRCTDCRYDDFHDAIAQLEDDAAEALKDRQDYKEPVSAE